MSPKSLKLPNVCGSGRCRSLLLTQLALAGCGVSATAPGGSVPVVQVFLAVGEETHTATVAWSASPDSPYVAPRPPVDPSAVDLEIVGPSGAVPLVPNGQGQFRIDISAVAGATYMLRGSAGGVVFQGSTVLPNYLQLDGVAGDTVSLEDLERDPTGILIPQYLLPIRSRGVASILGAVRFVPDSVVVIRIEEGFSGPYTLRGWNAETTLWGTSFDRLRVPLDQGVGVIGGVIDLHVVIVP